MIDVMGMDFASDDLFADLVFVRDNVFVDNG